MLTTSSPHPAAQSTRCLPARFISSVLGSISSAGKGVGALMSLPISAFASASRLGCFALCCNCGRSHCSATASQDIAESEQVLVSTHLWHVGAQLQFWLGLQKQLQGRVLLHPAAENLTVLVFVSPLGSQETLNT